MELISGKFDYKIESLFDIEKIDKKLLNENEVKAILFLEKWLNDEAFVFTSSGSTGKPKKFKFEKHDLVWSAQQTIAYFNLQNNPQHFFICLDINFVAGAMQLARALVLNAKVTIVNPSSNPFEVAENLHSYTFTSLVPLQVQSILDSKNGHQILNAFENILIGGAAIQSNLLASLKELKCTICLTYGMTETLSHIALWNIKTDKCFKLLPNNFIGTNSSGCLKIKNEITKNKWLQTNDIAAITNDGFTIKGRIDFVINTGAFKVNAIQVEAEIDAYFQQKQVLNIVAFVCGINDNLLGQKVVLCLEEKFKDLIVFDELKTFLKTRLKAFEIPKEIIYVEQILFTKSQKIDRINTLKTVAI